MADLTDYLKSINQTKRNIMRDEKTDDPKKITGFSPFIVLRLLSYHIDAIMEASEINCLPLLDEQLQYEYLLHAVTKKNRWGKLHKVTVPEELDLVKRFYNYSDAKAMEVIGLHTAEDFAKMRDHLSEGGQFSEKQSSGRSN